MNLVKRTLTAIVLLGSLYVIIQYAPEWVFFLGGAAFALAALHEFYQLTAKNGLGPKKVPGLALGALVLLTFIVPSIPLDLALFAAILAASVFYVVATNTSEKLARFPASVVTTLAGVLYVAFPLGFIFRLRHEQGPVYLYLLAAIVFLGDTGAFFIGKPLGRHKMTPIASPNKSWEGSAGGFLFAVIGAVGARFLLLPAVPLATIVLTALVVHAAAQASDPFESLFKRAVGVKDSSNSLPGHGGFLDRIDSLILAGPALYYIVKYFWK
jgi:phosphatidate cytidylyltransferase